MTVSPRLLSEMELLPKEYEQEIFDFVSFLRNKTYPETSAFTNKNDISIENAYGILKGTGIGSEIERDEEDRM
jgi:hypothetical protein